MTFGGKRDRVHVHLWPDASCDGPHRWGGEALHTVTASACIVTVKTCSMCGVVRIARERFLGAGGEGETDEVKR